MSVAEAGLALQGLAAWQAGRQVAGPVHGTLAIGSFTALVGANGAGKGSLLQALQAAWVAGPGAARPGWWSRLGALAGRQASASRSQAGGAAFAGRVQWQPPPGGSALHPRLVVLPQQHGVDRSLPLTVWDLLLMGFWPRLGAWRPLDAAHRRQAQAVLEDFGLGGLAPRLLAELSGGQFQRLRLARLALMDPAILLLDEPFTALDEAGSAWLLTRLQTWAAEGRIVLAVLHDLALARRAVPQALWLEQGRVRAWGPADQVLAPHRADAGLSDAGAVHG
ncbi:metal ABC transporter ATP-binding protein [Ideonella livida]|uniref:ATP-binding cassette domain-containing protein n=1 Tax=Ideonella livida TaxID=2707176 RepID=A0A7C9PH34_9BURK|nr:ATP-binding cassette domain-containing protein [Ideonella livida]NDY91756.1 ATP-binding cassette domain-containing protein [Ideonella livida]